MHEKREKQGRRLMSITAQKRAAEEAKRSREEAANSVPEPSATREEKPSRSTAPIVAMEPSSNGHSQAESREATALDERLSRLCDGQEAMSQALDTVHQELARPFTFLIHSS